MSPSSSSAALPKPTYSVLDLIGDFVSEPSRLVIAGCLFDGGSIGLLDRANDWLKSAGLAELDQETLSRESEALIDAGMVDRLAGLVLTDAGIEALNLALYGLTSVPREWLPKDDASRAPDAERMRGRYLAALAMLRTELERRKTMDIETWLSWLRLDEEHNQRLSGYIRALNEVRRHLPGRLC